MKQTWATRPQGLSQYFQNQNTLDNLTLWEEFPKSEKTPEHTKLVKQMRDMWLSVISSKEKHPGHFKPVGGVF